MYDSKFFLKYTPFHISLEKSCAGIYVAQIVGPQSLTTVIDISCYSLRSGRNVPPCIQMIIIAIIPTAEK